MPTSSYPARSAGRSFTLYREGKNSSSTSASSATRAASRVVYSVIEWIDEGIRLPAFTLQLGSPFDPSSTFSKLEKISMPMVSAMRGRKEVEPSNTDFGSGTKLGGRSTLSGPDAAAARALFSNIVCEALDPLVDHGRVEAEPGLLVLRELPTSDLWTSRKGKFPYPWEIEEYLEHADQVLRVFVT